MWVSIYLLVIIATYTSQLLNSHTLTNRTTAKNVFCFLSCLKHSIQVVFETHIVESYKEIIIYVKFYKYNFLNEFQHNIINFLKLVFSKSEREVCKSATLWETGQETKMEKLQNHDRGYFVEKGNEASSGINFNKLKHFVKWDSNVCLVSLLICFVALE